MEPIFFWNFAKGSGLDLWVLGLWWPPHCESNPRSIPLLSRNSIAEVDDSAKWCTSLRFASDCPETIISLSNNSILSSIPCSRWALLFTPLIPDDAFAEFPPNFFSN